MSPPRNSEAGSSLRTSALVYTYRRRSFISTAADGAAAGLSGVVGGGWVVLVLLAAHLTCAHPCPCRQPNTEGIWELVTGGVFYCLGMVFFKSDGRIPFAHAIWHLFVAFGAGTHYYAIWRYLYLPSTLQAKVSK